MKLFIWVMALAVLFSGCSWSSYQSMDFSKRPDGEFYIKDTPRTWSEMKAILDAHLNDEMHSNRPQGGYPTWDAFWLQTFKTWRNGRLENSEKYVNYIKKQRRVYGLPEINEQ